MSDPFRNYDQWLNRGNPADEDDDPICEECDGIMEWDVDVDVDEDTGKAYVCGGSWECRKCASRPPDDDENTSITDPDSGGQD